MEVRLKVDVCLIEVKWIPRDLYPSKWFIQRWKGGGWWAAGINAFRWGLFFARRRGGVDPPVADVRR